jgi:hypothetical protein
MILDKATADAAITVSKAVVVVDHLKNNRIEYLILVALGHLLGATAYVSEKAAGVCA